MNGAAGIGVGAGKRLKPGGRALKKLNRHDSTALSES